jgi:aspartyl protease family protein
MSNVDTGHLIYLIVLLLMVAGWFFAQNRLSMNRTLQYAAVWGLIFIGGVAAVGLWQDISNPNGARQTVLTGTGQIVVPRARDGHYYLTLTVNAAPIEFVVDTGATDMVLTTADARKAGLDPDSLNYLGRANTANGEVRTAFVRLDAVQLGDVIDRDIAAVVNMGEMEQSLLGMGYLHRWGRIEIADGELILTR